VIHPSFAVNPPVFYGPVAEGFTLPTPNYGALSTALYIYRLLTPSGQYPWFAAYADVRDIAKAHILALTSPPTSVVGHKRILFASPHGIDFKAVIENIADKRPELKGRLIEGAVPEYSVDRLPVDFTRIEEVLGLKKQEYIGLERTILDTVDSLLEIEKVWVSKGYAIEIPRAE
jgi:nucleoside-diphosphate-sugar epimerase